MAEPEIAEKTPAVLELEPGTPLLALARNPYVK